MAMAAPLAYTRRGLFRWWASWFSDESAYFCQAAIIRYQRLVQVDQDAHPALELGHPQDVLGANLRAELRRLLDLALANLNINAHFAKPLRLGPGNVVRPSPKRSPYMVWLDR